MTTPFISFESILPAEEYFFNILCMEWTARRLPSDATNKGDILLSGSDLNLLYLPLFGSAISGRIEC